YYYLLAYRLSQGWLGGKVWLFLLCILLLWVGG
ncbi:MAG: hypothetical protein ACI87Q_003006, partial [Pseudohongiellaceae bacterium]